MQCVVTGEHREDTPEERVRQQIAYELIYKYGYRREDMRLELAVQMGSNANKRADIAIFPPGAPHRQDEAYIIVECKRADISDAAFEMAKEQLKSYMAACNNAHFGMAVAGDRRTCLREIKHPVISLEVDVPKPSALPTTEAKLLAGGKVAYKVKNEKRLREQYLRLVVGLALRCASEAMLNLPSCQRVGVRAFRTALDPSIGRPARRSVLEVQFDYPTLAPMTMDGIDPVSALKHFEHRINVDRQRDLQALDASPG